MNSVSSTLFWCTRAPNTLKISITRYPVMGQYTIHRQDIWIIMVGINPQPISLHLFLFSPKYPSYLLWCLWQKNIYIKSFDILQRHYIHYFILKAGDSVHEHPNNNGPKIKINNLYGNAGMTWMRNHGNLKFTPPHLNSVTVETWEAFKLLYDKNIQKYFNETLLLPLSLLEKSHKPPSLTFRY